MYYIKEFDPWSSSLCTCPSKYSLNPYTGCNHSCIYCYITSYIPNAFHVRIKKDLLKKLNEDIKNIDKNRIISLSNSSDPYPTVEKELMVTRKILGILTQNQIKYQIITKSDLVLRDLDILKKSRCCVAITITTLKCDIARKLEPNAPSPTKRIKALEKLHHDGIPVIARIDPIIPFLNDKEIEPLIKKVSFVDHVVVSTFKPRVDSWKRFSSVFPNTAKMLWDYYFKKGEKVSNSWYLPKEVRLRLLRRIRRIVEDKGMSFGSCRENFYSYPCCDGSYLIE